MSQTSHLRLLPWSGPEGKPAHLVTDGTETFLSRLADDIEATQLDTGTEVLKLSQDMLSADGRLTADEMFYVTQRLAECLTDALRIAESRGLRIPEYED